MNKRLIATCFALLLGIFSIPSAKAAIVWDPGSYFGPVSTAFCFDIYVIHDADTDDDYYSTYGIYADIAMPGDSWYAFANSSDDVKDENINAALGNFTYVNIYDGVYSMDAYKKMNGQDYGPAFHPRAMCSESGQDCYYFQ